MIYAAQPRRRPGRSVVPMIIAWATQRTCAWYSAPPRRYWQFDIPSPGKSARSRPGDNIGLSVQTAAVGPEGGV